MRPGQIGYPKEVANLHRVSPATAYRLADDPSFPVTRVGRSWRIRADALDPLAARPHPAQPEDN